MTFRVRAELAARRLDLDLTLGAGERLAILGPNGAGKSSALAVVAGLLRPDSGRAELDGRVLFDLTAGRGRWLAPHTRGVALLAQDPVLFPHLSVLDNVAFGPRAAGQSRRSARGHARSWLAQVGADDLAGRRPGQLSGGQAQRVAIARALATEPQLLLLDEPLAALDVEAAPELRQVLRRVLADRAAIIVTHDLLDALVLAGRVAVLEQGHVVESGATAAVLRHPKTAFAARIAGLNLVTGVAVASGVAHPDGTVVEGVSRTPVVPGQPAVAVFSPSAVAVFPEMHPGSPRNTFRVTISGLEPHADLVRVRAETAGGLTLSADVTPAAVAELELYPGSAVCFSLKASSVSLHLA